MTTKDIHRKTTIYDGEGLITIVPHQKRKTVVKAIELKKNSITIKWKTTGKTPRDVQKKLKIPFHEFSRQVNEKNM